MPVQRHVIYACPGNIVNISILSPLLPSVFSDFCVTRKPISAAKNRQHPLSYSASSECLIWTPCFFEWSSPLHKIIAHKKTLYVIRNIRRHTQRMIAPTKKTPSLTPKAPITATKHQRILPQSYVRPQNTGYVSKNTATPAQNQTCVLSKHHHIINNLRLFPQKHTFFCLHNRKMQHGVQHRAQNQSEKHELCRPILTPRLSLPHRFRCAHAKKHTTPMSDRYARPE